MPANRLRFPNSETFCTSAVHFASDFGGTPAGGHRGDGQGSAQTVRVEVSDPGRGFRPRERAWLTAPRDWPAPARAKASDACRLYGPPDEAGSDQLLWRRESGFELVIRRMPAASG